MFVLISDLYEGGVRDEMLARVGRDARRGRAGGGAARAVRRGRAGVRPGNAGRRLAELGVPAFACTPDAFPDLLAVALERGDIRAWAAKQELDQRGMSG